MDYRPLPDQISTRYTPVDKMEDTINKQHNNKMKKGPVATLLDQTGSLDDIKKLKEDHQSGFYFPRRYIMAMLLFSICMLMNCQRSCLSVAIVAMSSNTKYWDGDQWIDQVSDMCSKTVCTMFDVKPTCLAFQ